MLEEPANTYLFIVTLQPHISGLLFPHPLTGCAMVRQEAPEEEPSSVKWIVKRGCLGPSIGHEHQEPWVNTKLCFGRGCILHSFVFDFLGFFGLVWSSMTFDEESGLPNMACLDPSLRPEGEVAVLHKQRNVEHVIGPAFSPVCVIYRSGVHMAKIGETEASGEQLSWTIGDRVGGRVWCHPLQDCKAGNDR